MPRSLWPLALLPLLFVGFFARLGSTSARDDAYVVVRRAPTRADGQPTALAYPEPDDAGQARVRRLMAGGFPAELLRTFAMTRRFVERTTPDSALTHARATAPLYLALGADDTFQDAPYRDRILGHGPFATKILADVPLVWVDDADADATEADADAAALDAIATGLGKAIVSLVAPGPTARDPEGRWLYPLRDGYVAFLRVVAAEWGAGPTGGGEPGHAPQDELRRSGLFGRVRANETARIAARSDAMARNMDRNPEVIAAVLYRLASSEVGRQIAPDDAYLPFLDEPPPRGIPAALLLGAFRGFQAKLLSAWSGAVRDGHAPAGLRDLIEAYAAAHPAERRDVMRILVVTTYGATTPGGPISPDTEPGALASELDARLRQLRPTARDLARPRGISR